MTRIGGRGARVIGMHSIMTRRKGSGDEKTAPLSSPAPEEHYTDRGLGPNLFYNSPMEACVVICRTSKPKARRGKILLINGINEVTRERAQGFLTDDHIEHIVQAYEKFADDPGFARVVTVSEVRAKDGNLSIPLYVAPATNGGSDSSSAAAAQPNLAVALGGWLQSSAHVRAALDGLLETPVDTSCK